MLQYLHVAATMAGLVLQTFAFAEMKSMKGSIME